VNRKLCVMRVWPMANLSQGDILFFPKIWDVPGNMVLLAISVPTDIKLWGDKTCC
jgi:hypothetical protein